jgi:hypothetical protein
MDRMYLNLSWMKAILKTYSNVKNTIQHRSMNISIGAGLWILIYTLKTSLQELLMMIAFICVGMLIFSSLIYYADDRKTFTSIPHSFW